ncbi:ABC transporter ATP-binding protein [Cupriavidus sp. L7L]|uniref:ABC transporter ATP-binding protein n=1 Tax=Cupriavidus sp. L7L TaxID=2546443 RepID=UPI001A9E22F8|nr:ABC transporter ATP-binding protein [Cupriavidus sp. L7L]
MTDWLSVEALSVAFQASGNAGVVAVQGVSFTLARGESLGIVGESGSGKSVTAKAIAGLLPSPARVSGDIRLQGRSLFAGDHKTLAALRAPVSYIFQNPKAALDPVFTIGSQLVETLRWRQCLGTAAAVERAVALLDAVGIPEPEKRLREFPHTLSGGMAQRVMIALSLACEPELLIADEPTSALDVSIQAQILSLLGELRSQRGASLIFISHDLSAVAELCDRVIVMHAGRAVEAGPTRAVIGSPAHPYTRSLIDAIPRRPQAQPDHEQAS